MATERDGPFAPSRWCALPALAPYAGLLGRFVDDERAGRWPMIAALQTTLQADVTFLPCTHRLPVGLDASDLAGSYVESCARGIVPTRPGNLHDFMNALTWALHPRAKRALAQRHAAVAHARGSTTNRLRTREQDRLSMVDEGGVLRARDGSTLVFGHGLLEDEVRGRSSRGLIIDVETLSDDDVAIVVRALVLDGPTVLHDPRR